MVLVWVCVLWLILFIVFLPFLLLSELLGWREKIGSSDQSWSARVPETFHVPDSRGEMSFTFDRRHDVSKLFGCNTRNVQYRWDLFANRLDEVLKDVTEPKALDFGAGSLRDSFELCKLGFQVISVDLNQGVLKQYYDSYGWNAVASPPQLFTNSIESLAQEVGANHFHLAIAFDVIEHLEDPAVYVQQIRDLLLPQGLLFTIVPNGRSFFERCFRNTIKKQKGKGIPWTPGVPHLQFKTPEEWEKFFEEQGFTILEHDMALGFFVNDCWNGWFAVPIRTHVAPVLVMLAYALRFPFNAEPFEKAFSPAWLTERVNVLDEKVKQRLNGRFGWNLIVAQPKNA